MFFIQMSGAPGSGKSTLAIEISKNIDVIILDHDVVKSSLLESDVQTNFAGKLSYNTLWSLADYYLSQGRSVLFDSPCFYNEQLEKGILLSEKHGANYKYVECKIEDLNELNTRLQNRKQMLSQVKGVNTDSTDEKTFQNWIDNMKRPSGMNYIVVDTSTPLSSYLGQVIRYIKNDI